MATRERLTLKGLVSPGKFKELQGKIQFKTLLQDNNIVSSPISSQQKIEETLKWLTRTFPQCFNLQNPKPLKRRIERDIYFYLPKDNSLSKKSIRKALAFYTYNEKYQIAVLKGIYRFDLEGKTVERISSRHKEFARNKISFWNSRKSRAKLRIISN
ncbi:MAG: hypothetical protein BGO67_10385 [Alphaproteobacteria bacterium 41-28]|nr:MAG: hypothetical protein BGO67_10385 [Alphaproteobacteria bacterium 41-28]